MSSRLPPESFQKWISLALATSAVCAVSVWITGSIWPVIVAPPVMWGTYYVLLGLSRANR
jgi:hypothetical protein